MAEKKGDDGNEGLPFGLCEKYDIRIDPSWSPRDAWNALERIGVYPPWSNKGGRQYSPTESGKTYYRQNASYGEILAADKRASAANVPTAVKFNRLHTKHHADHAREMGYKNMRDYEAAAVEFLTQRKESYIIARQGIGIIAMMRRLDTSAWQVGIPFIRLTSIQKRNLIK